MVPWKCSRLQGCAGGCPSSVPIRMMIDSSFMFMSMSARRLSMSRLLLWLHATTLIARPKVANLPRLPFRSSN
eukprot:7350934-Heterocapsa_arctica.AAC.1